MKKLTLFLLAMCCLLLCACAAKPREKEPLPAPEDLAAELLASGAFAEELHRSWAEQHRARLEPRDRARRLA